MPPAITTIPLSGSRGLVGDIARIGNRIPLFAVDRAMRLDGIAELRTRAASRIGWAATFLKAYALVAREMPVLRTWLARGIRPRLVTASESVATVAVNRTVDGSDRLFFAKMDHPDSLPLDMVQWLIHEWTTLPVEQLYRRQFQLEGLPGILRRTILSWNMASASPKRATRLGTFSLSTLAGQQALNRSHPTLCTTSLTYGPLESDGRCLVTLIADHRVLDGAAVARALERLEAVLTGDVMDELRHLRAPGDAAREAAA